MMALPVEAAQLYSEGVVAVDGSDACIDPPHADGHGCAGFDGSGVFETAKDEAVAHLLLEVVELAAPLAGMGEDFTLSEVMCQRRAWSRM